MKTLLSTLMLLLAAGIACAQKPADYKADLIKADLFIAITHDDLAGVQSALARGAKIEERNWLEITRNDLESAALAMQPAIGRALSWLNKAGSGFSRMSGSGATCFGLFETGNVAKRAAAEIRGRQPDWFVAATRSMSSEAE